MRKVWSATLLLALATLVVPSTDPPASASAAATKEFLAAELFERYSSPTFEVNSVPSVSDMMLMTVQHHQDAVDSARAFIPYAASSEVRAFAARIVRVQTQQIEYIRSLPQFPTDSTQRLWKPMVEVCGINGVVLSDKEFLSQMTLHHEYMITMYSQWIAAPDPLPQEFGMLLRTIGKGQLGEVAWMEQYRPS